MRQSSITCRLTILTLCLCVLVSLCPSSAAAAYPSELKVAPSRVYESILTNFKEKKYKNVKTALGFVEPIIAAIKTEFGIDLEMEIQSGLKAGDEGFYAAIRRLIFYDTRLIFTVIGRGEEKDRLRVLFKMSYANYGLLSAEFLNRQTGFETDRRIRKMFTKAYLDLGKESPYGGKTSPDLNTFKVHSDEIVDNLMRVFPEFGK